MLGGLLLRDARRGELNDMAWVETAGFISIVGCLGREIWKEVDVPLFAMV